MAAAGLRQARRQVAPQAAPPPTPAPLAACMPASRAHRGRSRPPPGAPPGSAPGWCGPAPRPCRPGAGRRVVLRRWGGVSAGSGRPRRAAARARAGPAIWAPQGLRRQSWGRKAILSPLRRPRACVRRVGAQRQARKQGRLTLGDSVCAGPGSTGWWEPSLATLGASGARPPVLLLALGRQVCGDAGHRSRLAPAQAASLPPPSPPSTASTPDAALGCYQWRRRSWAPR